MAGVTATFNDDCNGFAGPERALFIVVHFFAVREQTSS